VGDASLRFAAVGWTVAALLAAWVVVERRARKAAERAKEERDRDSDTDRAERMRRQREALDVMRAALASLDQERSDEP